jgi:hypothetical protein
MRGLAVFEDAHVPAASSAGAVAGVSVFRLASAVPLALSVSASDRGGQNGLNMLGDAPKLLDESFVTAANLEGPW